MKFFFRFLFFIFLLSLGPVLSGNDIQAQSRKVKRTAAKAEKKKEQQKKDYLISQDKDRQRRLEMQTPKTQKRMKETRKDAKHINDQNHPSFLRRLFHSKRK